MFFIIILTLKFNLKIYYQNVRGLRTKCENLYINALQSSYDLIVLTESWLNDTVFDHELLDDRYDIFRRDRSSTLSFQTKKEGGGICLAVLKKYRASRMKRWESACEELWVSFDLGLKNKSTINICAAYIPPPISRDYLTTFLSNLTDVVNNKISNGSFTLLVGDFNLPNIVWESTDDANVYTPKPNNGTIDNMFIDEITFNNLKQCNCILNNNNRMLDLVLVDNANNVKVVEASLPLVGLDPHHPALEILIHSLGNIKPFRSKRGALPNYSKCDFDAVNKELTQIVWSEIWSELDDVDSIVDKFYGTILSIIRKHTPYRIPHSEKYPVWFSTALVKCLNEKAKYHKKYKRYGNPLDRLTYELLRDRSNTMI